MRKHENGAGMRMSDGRMSNHAVLRPGERHEAQRQAVAGGGGATSR